jgi:mRNA-degrading endonuclease RelE of RelBE toxin-antitoxin system
MKTMFKLKYTDLAKQQFKKLKEDKSKQIQYKAVGKALACMQQNLRHPALNAHEYGKLTRDKGYKVFESYAQNNTSGAYRIIWRYGPGNDEIEIIAITSHP